MASTRRARQTAAPRATPLPADRVRNVALLGPAGAGKTSLVRALLAQTGAPDPGDEAPSSTREVRLAVLEHGDVAVNLLDTPGHPELVAGLRAGLRAADAALFVVSAAGGLDARTAQLWEECAAADLPRAVVVTQLDRPGADFDETLALCRRLLGEDVHPLLVPLHGDDEHDVAGLLDLLRLRLRDWSSGRPVERGTDPQHEELVEGVRAELLEAILADSDDDALLDRYLAGEPLDLDLVVQEARRAVRRGRLHPVLAAAPATGVGTEELLDLVVTAFPSPLQAGAPPVAQPDGTPAAPLVCDPGGPLAAEVVGAAGDPALVRIFSGTLRVGAAVHVGGRHGSRQQRVGAVLAPQGAALRPAAECFAGQVCVVDGLEAQAGETVSSTDEPLLLAPWDLPEPQHALAVAAAAAADEGPLTAALSQVAAEDPAVRLERRSGQVLLWCLGEHHAGLVLDRLRVVSGLPVQVLPVQVPLCETPAEPASGTGRHGPQGQQAVVVVRIEPLPVGSGVVVETATGGAARDGSAAAEEALRAQASSGAAPAARPLVDVRVVVVEVEAAAASLSAVPAAAAEALHAAVAAAGVRLLEPWVELQVEVPRPFAGAVVGDLAGRRAQGVRKEPAGEPEERVRVHAQVPEAELLGYAAALAAASHGTARARRRPVGYRPVPE